MANTSEFLTPKENYSNTDKTNLVKSAMPCDYIYDKDTQEITITGPVTNAILSRYEFTPDKAKAILYFTYTTKGGKQDELRQYLNDPFRAGVSGNAVKAVFIQLQHVAETYLGRRLTAEDNYEFTDLETLVNGMLSKLTVPTAPIGNLLVEFKEDESKYINLYIYSNKCTWISNKAESIDNSVERKSKMTLLVEDARPATPSSSSSIANVAVPSNSNDLPF